jgi:hypothetical protein
LPYLNADAPLVTLQGVAALSVPGSRAVIEQAGPLLATETMEAKLREFSAQTGLPKACFDEMASFSVGVNRSQVIRCAKLLAVLGSGQLLVWQTPRRNPPFGTWTAGMARTATDRALRWN